MLATDIRERTKAKSFKLGLIVDCNYIIDIVQAAMRNRKLRMKNGVDPPRIKREPKSWPVCLVKWPQSV